MTIRLIRFFLLAFLLQLILPNRAEAQYILQSSQIPIIEKMTKEFKGKSLNLRQLDNLVREISADGLFQIVYVEKLKGNNVVIRAQQSTKLGTIRFTGNNSFEDSRLLEILNISPGQLVSDLEIQQAVDRIKSNYEDSGFFNFKVTHKKTMNEGQIDLTIAIDEQDYCIIDEVRIDSKSASLDKMFQDIILKFEGSNYKTGTSNDIEKLINESLLENRFLIARAQNTATIFNQNKTRVKINFTISNAVQFEFIFHGNKHFSHFDLIKSAEIGSKFLYLSDSGSEIRDQIIALYEKAGFPQVAISLKEQYFEETNKKVFVFYVNEGPRIRIGPVNVVGKISREKSFYAALFHEYLAEQAHSVFFVRKDVELAAEAMVTHLKRQGHLQAELLSVNYELAGGGKAKITIQLDEGILTYVRQILFRGSKSYSNIKLKEVVEIEANKPLNIEEIETSFDKLETFYKNDAYLEFNIKNRNATVIQYNPGQPYADIVYQVSEGPKIKVEDIKVTGLEKTQEYVIRRELDFVIGEYLTLDKVQTSINRLERMALFGKVNIRSLEQGSPKSERTIIIELEERKPGVFSAGVGLESQGLLTYRGYVGALYNNLWGKARGISSRVDLGYQEQFDYVENRVALSYYEPYIFKSRVRGRLSLVREQQIFDPTVSSVLSTNDIRFSTEKEFSRHFRLTYNVWGFSNQEFFELENRTTESDSVKVLNIGTTGPVFEFDYRNDPFLPTSGSYTRVDIEYADPILGSSRDNPEETGVDANGARLDQRNEINYLRATVATSYYLPLTKNKRWVWANSIRGGYLQNISSREDSGVPQNRSFFLGGSSTIRGFPFGEIVPGRRELCLNQGLTQIGQETDCRLEEVFVRDDSAFFLIKSELRFPISGNFGGLVFYDGGAVYLGEFTLEDPYRDSVGIGLRYDTPVGSFSIEMGYKLDRKLGGVATKYDKESDIAIHLSIGTF